MHMFTNFFFLLIACACHAQITINDKSASTRQAVVIRTNKVTVSNPKFPSTVSAEKPVNPLKVLVIGTKEDVAAIHLLTKIADILANAGWQVTLLSAAPPFLPRSTSSRYILKQVDYGVRSEALVNAWNQFSVLERIRGITRLSNDMLMFCEKVFARSDVIDWIRNEKFDIAITSGATCFHPLLRMAGIQKSIIFTTSEPAPWIVRIMGIPETENPTINALPYFRRAKAVLFTPTEERLLQYSLISPLNDMGQRMVGDRYTPIQDAVAQTSFLLVNSDELVDFPRALTSQWVYVGGLDVKQPSKLNQEWNTLLATRARNVLVSFEGASPQCSDKTAVILHAFLEIPDTTFIWQLANGKAQNQSNVVFINRFSETDLLADPRVTVIITDGRTSSLYDIVAGGKPVICVPTNFEQQGNCDRLHERGAAIVAGCNSLTSKNVKEMIRQSSAADIRESSKTLSEVLKSKLLSRSEKLVRTVEYAAKHGATPRSYSSVSNGSFTHYHLDIFIPLILVTVLLIALFAWLSRLIVDKCAKRRPESNDELKTVETPDPEGPSRNEKPDVGPAVHIIPPEEPPHEGAD